MIYSAFFADLAVITNMKRAGETVTMDDYYVFIIVSLKKMVTNYYDYELFIGKYIEKRTFYGRICSLKF